MALVFGIRVLDSTPTTFGALKVEVSIENTGPGAFEIPSPDDTSGALTIAVYYPGGKLLRSMNGLSRQLMRSSGRVNAASTLAPIQPGEIWRWTIDLAKYHYTLPEGEFEIEGLFEYLPLNLQLSSERQRIRVVAPPMQTLDAFRDNPVIDRLDLLLRVGRNGSSTFYLRQYSKVPLAAAYSEPLPVAPNGTTFCASANYFQTATFEPVSKRWLLWTNGRELSAIELMAGVRTAKERRAILPAGRLPLGSAYYTEDDRLFVFLRMDPAGVECWEFGPESLEQVFAHTLRAGLARDAVVRAGLESIYIVVPADGLMYERLNHSGGLLDSRRVFNSRLKPCLWQFDAVERIATAVFWDAPHGRSVEMFALDFRSGEERKLALDSLGLRSPIREWSFAPDQRGRFHLLVSTTRNRLYYFLEGKGPVLVAMGEERFLPMVVAHRQVFLGCYRKAFGYRFLTFSNASYQPKFAEFEATP